MVVCCWFFVSRESSGNYLTFLVQSNINAEPWFNAHFLLKDGPGTGYNTVRAIAAFEDGSLLLVGTTEGSWASDNLGGSDFAVSKLSASGDPEWYWQVILRDFS